MISHTQPLPYKVSTVMLHGVYKQEIYNISFDTGAKGREKLLTLGSKIFLVMIVTGIWRCYQYFHVYRQCCRWSK